ncbi:MAG: helix-turn-helix domain-containing protein, partial [Streptomyces sp.]|nr:helix-turn-helix domain-containing protein [Streptomyces sp.]
MNRIPPECARLAVELRMLRLRSALTLTALAEETCYSKSSWHRYLTGTALPPLPAVQALCRLAGDSQPRLHALWELAETAWSGRDSTTPAATPALAA